MLLILSYSDKYKPETALVAASGAIVAVCDGPATLLAPLMFSCISSKPPGALPSFVTKTWLYSVFHPSKLAKKGWYYNC